MRSIDTAFPDRRVVEVSVLEAHLRREVRPSDAEFVSDCAAGRLDPDRIARLAALDPSALPDAAKVDLIRAWERVRAHVEGRQQAALAAVHDATVAAGLDGQAARHEVAAALRLSASAAYDRVRVAVDLTRRLPATLGALQAGDLPYLLARHLAEAVEPLSDDVAAAVEARVLPGACSRPADPDSGQSLGEFRRAVANAILREDPAGAHERHQRAAARRGISRHPQSDAMEGWWVTLPASAAGPAWDTLTSAARATRRHLRESTGIDPGLDALRVDTLLQAILGHSAAAAACPASADGPAEAARASAHGSRGEALGNVRGEAAHAPADEIDGLSSPVGATPLAGILAEGVADARLDGGELRRCRCGGTQTVAVVLDLATLLGLADHPGEIPGHGPVPAALARELAADRDWERWLIHPRTGGLLDRSPHLYRPGRRLRGLVAATHRTCGFPACTRPAEACDTDHRVTFTRGGRTQTVNLGPLCRQHHNAKTHGLWNLRYDPATNTWLWTSPLGKTYRAVHDPPLRT